MVVEGTFEHFEGTIDGKLDDDAVRLIDVGILDSNPGSEGD